MSKKNDDDNGTRTKVTMRMEWVYMWVYTWDDIYL